MAIGRRVTARFRSRQRSREQKVHADSGAPPVHRQEKIAVRNLQALAVPMSEFHSDLVPVSEFHSDLVSARTDAAGAADPADRLPKSLSAYLRDARPRADEILRQHTCREEVIGPACRRCVVAYPCDAVRAARDVIAISEKLALGRPLCGEALLALVTELVDLGVRAGDAPEASR